MKIEDMRQEHLEMMQKNYIENDYCCYHYISCNECCFSGDYCNKANREERYKKVCAELERRELKRRVQKACPFKKGDKVLVWNYDEACASKKIFHSYDPALEYPYITLSSNRKGVQSYRYCELATEKVTISKKYIAELLGKPDVEIEVIE